MRKNYPLIIGSLILLIIILITIFPNLFTSINPYGTNAVRSTLGKNGFSIDGAPFAPSLQNILGTDQMGRDIFSFIIYGTKLTITLSLFVVLGRFLIALPIGIAAGMGIKFFKELSYKWSMVFSSIPSLLVSVFILKLSFFTSLYKTSSILAFIIILSLVDWSRISLIIQERVRNVLSMPFIKGEIALGKSYPKIILQNVIPHISSELVIMFFMEEARALSNIMQLAVFSIFIGNMHFIADSSGGGVSFINISYEPEWASLLASSTRYISSAPWMVLSPSVAFFMSILGFNLFGEGLKEELSNEKPRTLGSIKDVLLVKKRYLKYIIIGAGIAIIISLSLRLKGDVTLNTYHSAFEPPASVTIGSVESKSTSEFLASSLKSIGVKPLSGSINDINNYIDEYKTPPIFALSQGAIGNLKMNKDFAPMGFCETNISGSIYEYKLPDIYSLKDYSQFDGKIVLYDGTNYTKGALEGFASNIMNNSKALAVLCSLPRLEVLPPSFGQGNIKDRTYWLTKKAYDTLNSLKVAINISTKITTLAPMGRNIYGIIPGKDKLLSKQAIVLGFNYNYSKSEGSIEKHKIDFSLSLMKKLKANIGNRSIIIAYFDGTKDDKLNGINQYVADAPYPEQDTVLFVDMTNLDNIKGEVSLNSMLTPISKYYAWNFSHQFMIALSKDNINYLSSKNIRPESEILSSTPNIHEIMYYQGSIPTLSIDLNDDNKTKNIDLNTLGTKLLKIINNNNF